MDKLTGEHKEVYSEIMSSVVGGSGGLFFVYGYGGTGKHFCGRLYQQVYGHRSSLF